MESLKPKKKFSGLKFDDDVDFNFRGAPSSVVALRISTSKRMTGAIDRTKWHLSQVATQFYFWSPHQAGSSAILGHFENMSSELEFAGLAHTANHFIENFLNCL